jgi:glycosyltransferase involved in cell wall biosynthesis
MNTKFKNKTILFLVHSYNSFEKDQIELIAGYFKTVYVLVRYKPIAEISRFFPVHTAKEHSYKIQFNITGTPKNVKVIPIPLWYLPLDFFYKVLGNYNLRMVKRLIKKRNIKFDIIHSHFIWTAGYVGAKLKEFYNVPFFLSVHENRPTLLKELNFDWTNIHFTLGKADTILVVNKSTIPMLLEHNKMVLHVSNGFLSSLFYEKDINEARDKLGLPKGMKIITTIGSLEKIKGQKYLISAIKLLKQKREDFFCLIIGIGSMFNTLQKQIDDLNLSKCIILTGRKSHTDLVDWINASDLFVLSSLSESFGVVQIEAMACGKPVVATRNGGSDEIIVSDDVGYLCDTSNPDDLAEKIELALNKEWNKDKISRYAQNYTWEESVEKILNIYSNYL